MCPHRVSGEGKIVAEGTPSELKRMAHAVTLDDAFIKLTGEDLARDEEVLWS